MTADRSGHLAAVALLALLAGITFALPTHADAPPCRYESTADTVLDRTTKLLWQRKLDGTTRDYKAAVDYCNNLTISGTKFRLPTVKELSTIVDVSRTNPAIDTSAFPNEPSLSAAHWTSTRYAKDDTNAWFVQFLDGIVYFKPVTTNMLVRCVKA